MVLFDAKRRSPPAVADLYRFFIGSRSKAMLLAKKSIIYIAYIDIYKKTILRNDNIRRENKKTVN
ncbi:hypothetical protein DRW42_10620 [Pedobacter miscanthi]|uniref:Uncharacterized protein n=1 Tax=Pedobacter miscanthi TaxID=2259170 RepID=A0A366L2D1_9SPHI|nr:hypothetical protein DRW42_10620 [Pedobacter miscanthi]